MTVLCDPHPDLEQGSARGGIGVAQVNPKVPKLVMVAMERPVAWLGSFLIRAHSTSC